MIIVVVAVVNKTSKQ
ncbi:Protein of unknown function [Leuconostoc citreum]|nr:Protein of unknown function [Leuconostoc citreum]